MRLQVMPLAYRQGRLERQIGVGFFDHPPLDRESLISWQDGWLNADFEMQESKLVEVPPTINWYQHGF